MLRQHRFAARAVRRNHCVTARTVLTVGEATLKQLYCQNPSFGSHSNGLVAGRPPEDVRRVAERFPGSDGNPPPQHCG